MADSDNDDEHTCKKFPPSCPNLKINFKFQDKDGNSVDEKREYAGDTYDLIKQSMILCTAMSCGADQPEVTIDLDVSPKTFDLADKLLQDPTASRSVTPRQALDVVRFYDKYHIEKGMRLCDDIFKDFITAHSVGDYSAPIEDLNLLVDIMVAAEEFVALTESKPLAREYIASRFLIAAIDSEDHNTAVMFAEEHLKKLQPLILNTPKLRESKYFMSSYSTANLESDSFPQRCKSQLAIRYTELRSMPKLKSFILSGSNCAADGQFALMTHLNGFLGKRHGDSWNEGRKVDYLICQSSRCNGDWAIVAKETHVDGKTPSSNRVLWKRPNSRHMKFPPKEGWLSQDPHAGNVQPKIHYLS